MLWLWVIRINLLVLTLVTQLLAYNRVHMSVLQVSIAHHMTRSLMLVTLTTERDVHQVLTAHKVL